MRRGAYGIIAVRIRRETQRNTTGNIVCVKSKSHRQPKKRSNQLLHVRRTSAPVTAVELRAL